MEKTKEKTKEKIIKIWDDKRIVTQFRVENFPEENDERFKYFDKVYYIAHLLEVIHDKVCEMFNYDIYNLYINENILGMEIKVKLTDIGNNNKNPMIDIIDGKTEENKV